MTPAKTLIKMHTDKDCETFHAASLPKFLNPDQIKMFLCPFKEDWIFVHKARFCDGFLNIEFNTFNHPFKHPTKHLTRNHIIMFTTQASHLLGGCLAMYDDSWPVNEKQYVQLLKDEQATFTDINLHFRQFIPNKDRINMVIWTERQKMYRRKLFLDLHFAFDSACYGNFKAILATDGSFVPDIKSNIINT